MQTAAACDPRNDRVHGFGDFGGRAGDGVGCSTLLVRQQVHEVAGRERVHAGGFHVAGLGLRQRFVHDSSNSRARASAPAYGSGPCLTT